MHWQEVLGLERIGIHDHFFRLGGDSIVCISLVSRLRRAGYCLQVKDVFAAPTVAQLAAWLENHEAKPLQVGEQGALTGRFGLLPVQAWFFANQLPRPNYFNQAFRLTLPDSITIEQIRSVLSTLSQRHDMLRCRFVDTPEGPQQEYLSDSATTFAGIERLNLARMSEAQRHAQLTALQCDFDIFHGPLWRVAYIDGLEGNVCELWFAAHHLIIDAVSWRILLNDVKALCHGECLGNKGSSYRQWVAVVEDYATQHAGQISWWQEQIANQPDYRLRDDIIDEYHQTSILLDVAQTTRMLKETATAFHTEINDLLLSALCVALQRWHGHSESWLTLEGHGREEIDPGLDIRSTVGWFTCLYPIKLAVKETLTSTVRHIKESLRAIPDKGIGFGALKYASSGNVEGNRLKAHHLPPISFNYLGQFISSEPSNHWQLATEGCGAHVDTLNVDNNLINIVGGVFQQRLHLSLTSRLRHDVAQKLANDFSEVLKEIIDLCAARSAVGHSLFTPGDFPDAAITLTELDRLQKEHAIENIYRATHFQRELMYFNRVSSDFQIDQIVHELSGPLEPELLGRAWAHVVAQHDILRAGFSDGASPGDPNVFICKKVKLPFQIVDWSGLDDDARRDALHHAILQQRNQPFDFERPPLFRLFIARAETERHVLIHTFNHILFDGWSLGTMMKEVSAAYVALQKGIPPVERPRSFAPFSAFLQRNVDNAQAHAFWEPYLQGAKLNQRLPGDTGEMVDIRRKLRMRYVESALTSRQNGSLYEFVKLHGYTANQLTQLAWILTLSERLDEDDICIGTTMSERPAEIDNAEHLVGLFVASPVLRLTAIRQRSLSDLLEDISATQRDRQQFAFHELNQYDQNWLPVSPFGSLFVFENMPEAHLDNDLPFRFKLLDVVSGSNHQTVFCLFPHKDGLQLRLFYDARELAEETVACLLTRFIGILDNMIETPVCLKVPLGKKCQVIEKRSCVQSTNRTIGEN
ncbi:condensation domain-containing protein [Paraburkholderia sp.]|uniref:condensation domain-containing protein n=1 Tax=Paraburkholderia sp. TaxID=1926495 RepID=UPI002AFFB77D|nr:condensation domain-containing protein [Paraburkholderia sp.]